MRRHDATHAAQGEPDGYGGLTTRGHPERLLLSEWLLAEELPLEFLRRAASRELLHINPAFRAPQPGGAWPCSATSGPDQLGAARLVQLAALIVLHRRALDARDGARGRRLRRSRPTVARRRAARAVRRVAAAREPSRRPATSSRSATATLDDADELWVLAGRHARRRSAGARAAAAHARGGVGRRRGDRGRRALRGRTTTLAVPPGRALRADPARGGAAPAARGPSSAGGRAALSCPSSRATTGACCCAATARRAVAVSVPTNRRGGRAPEALPVLRPGRRRDLVRRHAGWSRSCSARRPAALRGGRQGARACSTRIESSSATSDLDRDALDFDDAAAAVLRRRRPALPARRRVVAGAPRGGVRARHGAGRGRPHAPARPAVQGVGVRRRAHRPWRAITSTPTSEGVCGSVRGRGIAGALIDVEGEHTVLGVLTRGREQDPALVTVSQDGTARAAADRVGGQDAHGLLRPRARSRAASGAGRCWRSSATRRRRGARPRDRRHVVEVQAAVSGTIRAGGLRARRAGDR